MSNDNKIKTINPNKGIKFGLLIFLIILVYIIVALINYFTQNHVENYQVRMGSLSTNNIYKCLILRDESIVRSNQSGYVNYLTRETDRVGVGNMVYTLDQSGKLAEYLLQGSESNELTNTNLQELKTDIISFSNSFEPSHFSTVYDFKYNVEGTVLKLSNANLLSDINKINNSSMSSLVSFNYAPKSGYVIYSIDGYEDISVNDLTPELVDYKVYETEGKRKQLINNELVAEGDAVYKLATNEDWSIVFMTDGVKAQELLDEKYIKVKFLKNQDTSWGKVSVNTNEAGENYVMLTFTNSMLTFCTDRFIDVELILDDDNGLKVPNSSIIEKEFFIVPKEYLTKGGYNSVDGVLKQMYLEDGTPSTEFIPTTIYGETETEYYIDDMSLRMGDVLICTDSNQTFTLANNKDSLLGVYNINKGYADFKQIIKLYENDEYSIIKPNMMYGLNVYDYIVLDASTVKDDELIYD